MKMLLTIIWACSFPRYMGFVEVVGLAGVDVLRISYGYEKAALISNRE